MYVSVRVPWDGEEGVSGNENRVRDPHRADESIDWAKIKRGLGLENGKNAKGNDETWARN